MSVPFSNTNLRVPRGFGNILEGLAREVLRDQPDDIPSFASKYFSALLEQRDESGLDAAEWGARLEDRFYNNHAFKDIANQGNQPSSAKATGSPVNEDKANQAKSFESNGAQMIQPVQRSPSPENLNVSKELEPPGSNELKNIRDEESGEVDPHPSTYISYRGTADVDICAEGLKDTEEIKVQMAGNIYHTGGVSEENETPGKNVSATELRPTHPTSHRDAADVEICAEEQPSTLQEEEPAHEHAEHNSNLIDTDLAGVLESPKFFQVGELTEPRDAQDRRDEFPLSGAQSPADPEHDVIEEDPEHDVIEEDPEHDVNEEVSGVSSRGKKVTAPADLEEEDGTDYYYEHAQNTEIPDDVFEEAGTEDIHAEQLDLHEAKGGTEETFEERSPERVSLETDNLEAQETLVEYENTSESSSTREKVIVEDSGCNGSAEYEKIVTEASEVKGGRDSDWDYINNNEIIHDGIMSRERESEIDVQEGEKSDVKESHPKDLDTDVGKTSSYTPEKGREGWMDTSADLTAVEGEEGDTGTSQQVEIEDTTGTGAGRGHGTNEAEVMNESHRSGGETVAEAGEEPYGPVSDEPAEDTEVTRERPAEEDDCEEDEAEEGETVAGLEEQSEQVISPELLQEREHLEMDSPENKKDIQEETNQSQEEEDIMDIPLDDPEANKAAAKIQAGFRGHMTRKKLKPGDKPGEEVSSSGGETLNGSQGNTGGSEGVETDDTSVPEQ